MPGSRLFLDTFFVQALLNTRDTYHDRARALLPEIEGAVEVVVTEASLRQLAAAFVRHCYAEPNVTVVPVDTPLLRRSLELYEDRPDKEWGLTDCISFIVMRDRSLVDAATGDRHFLQAGFRALLS